jgi:acyl-CoA reductase-like NAD-dependent aldehyde dehydrogenase
MTTEPENVILRKLQEMRAEMAAQFAEIAARDEKAQAQIGVLAQGQTGMRGDIKRMADHIHEIAMAIDHHTTRLDRIEQHLGLDKTTH